MTKFQKVEPMVEPGVCNGEFEVKKDSFGLIADAFQSHEKQSKQVVSWKTLARNRFLKQVCPEMFLKDGLVCPSAGKDELIRYDTDYVRGLIEYHFGNLLVSSKELSIDVIVGMIGNVLEDFQRELGESADTEF